MGVITVPRALPRLVRLPSQNGTVDYISLADLVAAHAAQMYRGYEIISGAAFRITRNSNLYLQEEESRNLLESVRTELHNRRKGDAVRLEIEAEASAEIIERLRVNFEMQDWQVFRTEGPVNLSRLMHLYDESERPDLKFKPFAPRELQLSRGVGRPVRGDPPRATSCCIIPTIPTIRWCPSSKRPPRIPDVLSIKQTLYRTSEDSPIVQALIEAAAGKKEVTVVVELKARFDEAPNIRWAQEPGGCRRAGLPRAGRPEDALQAGADGAQGSR